eukprot:gb/GEZN01022699.1/.p1 GENE.gb/GEZN01022699.1/~~gb/GEZN01022699.1/.p1  ORF type:complete len:102 (-),score=7.06 gb/GEZN01022699.1/:210-515(-)
MTEVVKIAFAELWSFSHLAKLATFSVVRKEEQRLELLDDHNVTLRALSLHEIKHRDPNVLPLYQVDSLVFSCFFEKRVILSFFEYFYFFAVASISAQHPRW